MVRSSDVGYSDVPVWNGVFAGVDGAPAPRCGTSSSPSISVQPSVPLVAEKPYIISPDGKSFQLVVPGFLA